MANIDWSKLTFSYTKTNTILTTTFKDGAWTPVESHTDDFLHLSAYAGALHYAIECFEGLKAFRGKDGKIRMFRPEENAKRLKEIADAHPCVDKIELLPFRKICQVKYDSMGIPFPLAETPEPSPERMSELRALIEKYL